MSACTALTKKHIRCTRNKKDDSMFCKIHADVSATQTFWFQSLKDLWPSDRDSGDKFVIFMDKFFTLTPYFEYHFLKGCTKIIYKILLIGIEKSDSEKLLAYRKILFWKRKLFFDIDKPDVECSHCNCEGAKPTLCCGLHQCDDCFMKLTICECGFRHYS